MFPLKKETDDMQQELTQYDEDTVWKVYDVLRKYGLTETKTRECLKEMKEAGILFREPVKKVARQEFPNGGTHRGISGYQDAAEETNELYGVKPPQTNNLVGQEVPGER